MTFFISCYKATRQMNIMSFFFLTQTLFFNFFLTSCLIFEKKKFQRHLRLRTSYYFEEVIPKAWNSVFKRWMNTILMSRTPLSYGS